MQSVIDYDKNVMKGFTVRKKALLQQDLSKQTQFHFNTDEVYKISYNKDIELEAMIDITKGED